MGKTIAVTTKMKDPLILKAAIAEFYNIPLNAIETVGDLIQQINDKNKGKPGWIPVSGVADYVARNKKDPNKYPLLKGTFWGGGKTDKAVFVIRNKHVPTKPDPNDPSKPWHPSGNMLHDEQGRGAQYGSDLAFEYFDENNPEHMEEFGGDMKDAQGRLVARADDHIFGGDIGGNKTSFTKNPDIKKSLYGEYMQKELEKSLKSKGIDMLGKTVKKVTITGKDGKPKEVIQIMANVDVDKIPEFGGAKNTPGTFKASTPAAPTFNAPSFKAPVAAPGANKIPKKF